MDAAESTGLLTPETAQATLTAALYSVEPLCHFGTGLFKGQSWPTLGQLVRLGNGATKEREALKTVKIDVLYDPAIPLWVRVQPKELTHGLKEITAPPRSQPHHSQQPCGGINPNIH